MKDFNSLELKRKRFERFFSEKYGYGSDTFDFDSILEQYRKPNVKVAFECFEDGYASSKRLITHFQSIMESFNDQLNNTDYQISGLNRYVENLESSLAFYANHAYWCAASHNELVINVLNVPLYNRPENFSGNGWSVAQAALNSKPKKI